VGDLDDKVRREVKQHGKPSAHTDKRGEDGLPARGLSRELGNWWRQLATQVWVGLIQL